MQDTQYKKGLVIVHTGNGKGKTTAALGLAIRAWGEGLKVLILQFIKGSWKYGELKALAKFAPDITVKQCGEGFTRRGNTDIKIHQEAAKKALQEAKMEMISNKWDMIILDEINYAIDFDLVDLKDVLDLIAEKPADSNTLIKKASKPKKVLNFKFKQKCTPRKVFLLECIF